MRGTGERYERNRGGYLEDVVVHDGAVVLPVRVGVAASVQDAHLLEHRALAGLARAQQQDLDAVLHQLLLAPQVPVYRAAASARLSLLGRHKAQRHRSLRG